ncbi:hypothetical protein H9L19_00100 [Weissella diestrammenae]|uniref:Accessory Sec system protein translocase subunit SecY2 n=1 Tax=Weissella diestrammenae TaxID=1162633 RepID=A0A7G9T5H2_9LACO|nr:hypothetical protein [Weissella diestrammenae]MCM0583208.1 hypothetical protein [Weissella diestrammenae]QNN75347.1 hypothetical protein H9L19_00100 [Weissella diestrammenae]
MTVSRIVRKICFSLLLVLIYVLGMRITLPISIVSSGSSSLSSLTAMVGINTSTLSLFSMGLSPWMSVSIIKRALDAGKTDRPTATSTEKTYVYKILATIMLGALQSYVILGQQAELSSRTAKDFFVGVVLLVTGTLVLVWLSNMNILYGVGGQTTIVLFTIIFGIMTSIKTNWEFISKISVLNILIIVSIMVSSIFFAVMIQRAYLKLPMVRLMVSGKDSYLPIPINPSSGMPFMYSATLSLLPNYLVSFINMTFKTNSKFLLNISEFMSSSTYAVFFPIVIVVLLSYLFAYYNIDAKKISHNFEVSGDYIIGTKYGKNTQKHIMYMTFIVSTVSVAYNLILALTPLFINQFIPALKSIATQIQVVIVMVGIAFMIMDEVAGHLKHEGTFTL